MYLGKGPGISNRQGLSNRESCTKYLGGIPVKDEIVGIHYLSTRVFSFKKSDSVSP
jgi:hypothetical protein